MIRHRRTIWPVFAIPLLILSATACRDEVIAGRPSPTSNATTQGDKPVTTQKATFAAGCFWGVELEFSQIPGVLKTTVGYTGGKTKAPTYRDVCNHDTGHAEALLIEFDPAKVSYEKLVEFFFEMHDPTQVNRQGPDVGDQYRTAIFYHSPEQKATAEAVKSRLSAAKKFSRPIATQIVPAVEFYDAEDYHQQYFKKRGITQSCHTRP